MEVSVLIDLLATALSEEDYEFCSVLNSRIESIRNEENENSSNG